MQHRFKIIMTILACLSITLPAFADFSIPMFRGEYESVYVTVPVLPNNRPYEFILDTGSVYVIIGETLFNEEIKDLEGTAFLRKELGVSLADDITLLIYRISSIGFTDNCTLSNVDIAVIPSNEVNIIGMNVFERLSPYTVDHNNRIITGRVDCE